MVRYIWVLLSIVLFQNAANAGLQGFLERNAKYQGYDTDPTRAGTQLAGNDDGDYWGAFKLENGDQYFIDNGGVFYSPKDLVPDMDEWWDLEHDNDNRPPLYVVSVSSRSRAAQVAIVRASAKTTKTWARSCATCAWKWVPRDSRSVTRSVGYYESGYGVEKSGLVVPCSENYDGHLNGRGCSNPKFNNGRTLGCYNSGCS